MLIDSNIIIFAGNAPVVSAVSYVEVLGFHQLGEQEKTLLEAFFAATVILPLTQSVLDQAILIRQQRRMSLGDAFVAGTALVNNHTIATHNVKDFTWIDGLPVVDPLADKGASTS